MDDLAQVSQIFPVEQQVDKLKRRRCGLVIKSTAMCEAMYFLRFSDPLSKE
jgi:hypothetical protein